MQNNNKAKQIHETIQRSKEFVKYCEANKLDKFSFESIVKFMTFNANLHSNKNQSVLAQL